MSAMQKGKAESATLTDMVRADMQQQLPLLRRRAGRGKWRAFAVLTAVFFAFGCQQTEGLACSNQIKRTEGASERRQQQWLSLALLLALMKIRNCTMFPDNPDLVSQSNGRVQKTLADKYKVEASSIVLSCQNKSVFLTHCR